MKYMDNKIVNYLEERLCAHEGGAPGVCIIYDDATFKYMIIQKNGFKVNAINITLGCSSSLMNAFKLAIDGNPFGDE